MIRPETVELADRLPELQKRLVETRAKNAKARVEEEERHNKARIALEHEDGSLSQQIVLASRARKEITDAIPHDLHRAADNAGSDYRAAVVAIKHERDERAAAAEALEGYEGPKEGRAPLVEQLEVAQAKLERAEAHVAALKAKQAKAEASVETAYQKIRKEVLASAKADAPRGR